MNPEPLAVVVLALLLDVAIGEWPDSVHPVALYGRTIGRLDRSWHRPRLVGVIVVLVAPLLAAVLLGALTVGAFALNPVVGVGVATLALFSTVSLRKLLAVSRSVIKHTVSDPDRARTESRALVGRETDTLSPGELRSAAVESTAENLSDGLIAGLVAFTLGSRVSVAVGVAAATWVKAVNTMDSMLGYRSKPVGWASARLDDVLMWVPARCSALLIAVASRDPWAVVRARPWVQSPSSPNSGWPMATLAASAGVQLSKPGAYALYPAAELPTVEQARACVRTAGVAGLLSFGVTGVVVWF